jgi:hypothetical protein
VKIDVPSKLPCWVALGLLLRVWPLVGYEPWDVDVPHPLELVATNEAADTQLLEQGDDVAVLVRKYFGLDPQRPALDPAVSVGDSPQADEQQASQRVALCQVLVLEERRLDVSRPSHAPPP